MNPAARRHVLLTLLLAGVLVGGIGLFNYWIDPYNRFGNNRFGVYISAERESKPNFMRRFPHNALLVGDSRMANIPVSRLQGFRFYNGAFAGASSEEVYYFLEHFARKEELVIIGLGLGQCDPTILKGDIFAPAGWKSSLDNLLSLRTLEYSIRTMSEGLRGHPSMQADGSSEMASWFKLYDVENPALLKWQLEALKQQFPGYKAPSLERLTFLQKTAAILRERGIPCVVVIPPFHEELASYLQTLPSLAAYQEWLREVKSLFPYVVDLSLGTNGASTNFFKSDPGHFKPEVGVRMFQEEVMPVALKAVRR